MNRVRYDRKLWRKRWPWKWLFPPVVDERYCRKCKLPYQDGPQPDVITQFRSGNVGVLVFPAGGWKRDQFAMKCGRWRSHGRDYYLSPYLAIEDLDDLTQAAAQAHEYIYQRTEQKRSNSR